MNDGYKKYKFAVTYRYKVGIGSQLFDSFETAYEFFWSIRYKAYSIIKCDFSGKPLEHIEEKDYKGYLKNHV